MSPERKDQRCLVRKCITGTKTGTMKERAGDNEMGVESPTLTQAHPNFFNDTRMFSFPHIKHGLLISLEAIFKHLFENLRIIYDL